MLHMKKIIFVLIIAAFVAAAVFCPAVSARYTADGQENIGIMPGDVIFPGEENLNVTQLGDGTHTVDYLEMNSQKMYAFSGIITGVIGDPGSSKTSGYAFNNSFTSPMSMVTVAPLSTVFDNTQIPTEVKTGVSTIFTFENPGGLQGTKWASMVLKAEDGTILSSVTQNNTLSYKFDKEQTVTLTLDFSLNTIGTGVQASKTYTIKVTSEKSAVKLEVPSKLYQGKTGTVKLTGIPNTDYKVTVNSDGVLFENDAKEITVNVGQYGTANIGITIANTASGPYIFTVYKGLNKLLEKSVSVDTPESEYTIIFDVPPIDAQQGFFASGDTIRVSGSISPNPGLGGPTFTFYLYVTGHGLSPVNLKKQPVVDGEASTFTQVDFNPELGFWEAFWDTRYFEPGMYTIHLTDVPYIYDASVSLGEGTYLSQQYSLDRPTINVKFAKENGGLFTKGDVMYSFWSARGSPSAVRWYIIGPNFMETGIAEDFSLYTPDQEKGKDAPQGLYGFTYDRTVSNSMAAGSYYLLYQHPGFNGEFDVKPNVNEE